MPQERLGSFLKISFFAYIFLLCGTAMAVDCTTSLTQLTEAITKVREGKPAMIQLEPARVEAAKQLAELTREINPMKVNNETIVDLESLLDSSDDSVRYWVARSLGNLGPRAKMAVPKLQQLLTAVDCIRGDKTSASGIRFALIQIGVEPRPFYEFDCEYQQGLK